MSRSGILLCYPFEEKRLKKWGFPVIAQPKLDGERCRAKWDFEHGWYFLSSECNLIVSLPHLNDHFNKKFMTGEDREIEFDGELYHHEVAFNDLHSIIGRTKNVHEECSMVEFHCFDIIDENLTQIERSIFINKHFSNSEYFRIVPTTIINNLEELFEYYYKITGENYEGIIVRKLDGRYVRRRSTEIMKFKPKKKDHYKIVGYKEEISKKGFPKGTLGAFICLSNGQEFLVGSGFTKKQRVVFWRKRDSFIGKYCEISYQHALKDVPRFGVYIDVLEENPEEHYEEVGIDIPLEW